MEAGLIVQMGTPEEIIVNPQTEYVANFVEHADPTGVITANTIALPIDSEMMEKVADKDEISFYARRGYPRIHYGVDAEGRFVTMEVDGKTIEMEKLTKNVLRDDIPLPETRRHDLALSCAEDATLREILRGRLYSTLPIVVVSKSGNLTGVVNERDVVYGILEKRGHTENDDIGNRAASASQ